MWLVLAFTLLLIWFVWTKWKLSYWQRMGVPNPKPNLLFGNIGPVLHYSEHMGCLAQQWYSKFTDAPYVGYYKFTTPAVVLRDPDLIKDILIKDYYHFAENDMYVSEKFDPLLKKISFFSPHNDVWKRSRNFLGPALSQTKVKNIYPLMEHACNNLRRYLREQPAGKDFDAKFLNIKFMTENTVKCLFGLDAGCFEPGLNEFLEIGKIMLEPSPMTALKFAIRPILPKWLASLIFIRHALLTSFQFYMNNARATLPFYHLNKCSLGARESIGLPISPTYYTKIYVSNYSGHKRMVPHRVDAWFRNIVVQNMASRKHLDSPQNDFLQVFLNVAEKLNADETEVTGQVVSLFIGGIETSSSILTSVLYELGRNQDVQKRFYEEIVEVSERYDNKISYEAIQEMTYLDRVVHESLRLNPVILQMNKLCTLPYTLPKFGSQKENVKINPGTTVIIPTRGIHLDPELYPNPELFDPERFTKEEMIKRHTAHYLPFGEGSRMCVGMRFGQTQVKAAAITIVRDHKITLSPKQKPVVADGRSWMWLAKDRIIVNFTARN